MLFVVNTEPWKIERAMQKIQEAQELLIETTARMATTLLEEAWNRCDDALLDHAPVWRCTRRSPYTADCPEKKDVSVRQGYYIRARSWRDALERMRELFSDDLLGFDVQEWSEEVEKGDILPAGA